MGQHACCITHTELDSPNQRKGFYLVKGKRELFKNHSGHDDSVVTLPYQKEQRQQSVQVEDINSEQVLDGLNPLSASQQRQQQFKTKCQFHGQVRIREEYAKTFESNDIDLSKSDCPLESSSQGKCRLVMTSNQGTYTVPSSPTKVHVVNQLRVDLCQRQEYADKMSQYLVQYCQDGFKNHYYLGNKEFRGKAISTSCISSESTKTLQARIENDLKFLQFRLNQLLDNDDNSHVYVFVDANDCKLIKCMITGAAQTVFAYGVYIFDIYIPEDYPQHPPRVHLKQPNSKIGYPSRRLAPLLLEDGRVCLDILGIYLGIEKHSKNHWDPATSSLCQIIEAIRSEILCQDVFRSAQLTEGEEEEFKNDDNVRSNLFSTTASSVNRNDLQQYAEGYENALKYLTMTQAIEKMMDIEYIDVELENAITQHFTLCSEKIQQKIQLWIEQQQSLDEDNQPKYIGLVEQHNREIAGLMQKKGFVGCAKEKLNEIQGKLKKIAQIQGLKER